MWTQFWDMSSGGTQKEPWHDIFIEAPVEEAKTIFYNRFGHNPDRITCACCGNDYAIYYGDDIAQLTGYHRGCAWNSLSERYVEEPSRDHRGGRGMMTLAEYEAQEEVLFIRAEEIKPEERVGDVPEQGWVYV